MKEILISCAKNSSNTLDYCEPFVMFENFGDSSLDFAVYFFVDDAFTVLKVKSELRFEIDKQFRINNITIPFPQRDVHFLNPNA